MSETSKRVPLPNVGDLLFVGICQLLLFMRPHFIFSDGSTGWHLFTGFNIIKSGVIPHSDIMSYTFPGKAWVAYEWLSDVLMALLVQAGGLNLLALAVSAAIASLILAIYQRMRSEGCYFLAALYFCVVGLLASANHWLVRPHLFTFWGVYLFVTRLEDYYLDKISFKRLSVWLLAYMILWVNCHPAFLMGFAICSIYLAATFLQLLIEKNSDQRILLGGKASRIFGLLLALILVSFINPYGINLYHYIGEYLRGTAILAHTDEFKSPNFHFNLHAFCLELLFFLLAWGFVRSGKKVNLPIFLVTVTFAHMSLMAVRNIPLFAFISTPLLGRLFAPTGETGPAYQSSDQSVEQSSNRPAEQSIEHSILDEMLDKIARPLRQFDAQEKLSNMHILPFAYVLVLACVAIFGGYNQQNILLRSGFDPESQPVQTLAYLKEHKLEAREGLSLDNWGGIIRYQLDMPVFIDDRSDFYGEKFYNQYGIICEVRPGYNDLLDQHHINWILFPKESTLVQTLKNKSDWLVVCEDQASCLLVRKKTSSDGR